jgi:hypothetical protein
MLGQRRGRLGLVKAVGLSSALVARPQSGFRGAPPAG